MRIAFAPRDPVLINRSLNLHSEVWSFLSASRRSIVSPSSGRGCRASASSHADRIQRSQQPRQFSLSRFKLQMQLTIVLLR
jgi:hypothetical protein